MDLAYPVKNARRDFANGFLAAEIFSRYYPHDIHMHSFDNGNGLRAKRDNWRQLRRFFGKRGINEQEMGLDDAAVEEILHCRGAVVIRFVQSAYELLSGRRLQPTATGKVATQSVVPAYAKDTASATARLQSRDPRMGLVTDTRSQQRVVQEALKVHKQVLDREREVDPDRFVPVTVRARHMHEASKRQAARGMAEAPAPGSPAGRAGAPSVATAAAAGAGSASADDSGQRCDELLGACVHKAFVAGGHTGLLAAARQGGGPGESLAGGFQMMLAADDAVSDELAASVMQEVEASAPQLAAQCLSGPRGFLRAAALLNPILLATPEDSAVFEASTEAYVALGREMVGQDAHVAHSLFVDFALPGLASLLRDRPEKRHAALRALYSFTPAPVPARLNAIQEMRESLRATGSAGGGEAMHAFLHCLAVLVHIEPSLEEEAIVDIYLYYAQMGISSSSPSLRAASVSTVSLLAAHNLEAAAPLVIALRPLLDDPWWEVKAQLLMVGSAMLERCPSQQEVEQRRRSAQAGDEPDGDAARERALQALDDLDEARELGAEMVQRLLEQRNGAAVQQVGLSHIAPLLVDHQDLLPLFVRRLLELPEAARGQLLDEEGEQTTLRLRGASGARYVLPPLPGRMDSNLVGRVLVEMVQRQQLDSLEPAHLQLLLALLQPVPVSEGGGGAVQRQVPRPLEDAVFRPLQNHVLVGICHPLTVHWALAVLRVIVFNGNIGHEVLYAPTLTGSLLLLHQQAEGDPDPLCGQAVAEFFAEVADRGAPYIDAVRDALGTFADKFPAVMDASPLAPLAQTLLPSGGDQ